MGWWQVTLLVLLVLFFVTGLTVLFLRPTGPRIVRFAQRYRAVQPSATEREVRDALRQRFLGGLTSEEDALDAVMSPQFWLAEKFLLVLEGLRDYLFPIDRKTIAQRIEAAVMIVFPPDPEEASTSRNVE